MSFILKPDPMPDQTLPPDYFDAVYAANADPWQFATSDYERAKYAATMAALPAARYESVFEIGCSIGVLTAALADRCANLLAVDVSETALQQARARLAHAPHATLRRMNLPAEMPDETFDLILLSEVGYYWSRADLDRAKLLLISKLNPGGHLLLVHWTPVVHDYPQTGDDVHDQFMALAGPGQPLHHLDHQRQPTYRLDLFARP
jgi:SAM-dependent methyltransferase